MTTPFHDLEVYERCEIWGPRRVASLVWGAKPRPLPVGRIIRQPASQCGAVDLSTGAKEMGMRMIALSLPRAPDTAHTHPPPSNNERPCVLGPTEGLKQGRDLEVRERASVGAQVASQLDLSVFVTSAPLPAFVGNFIRMSRATGSKGVRTLPSLLADRKESILVRHVSNAIGSTM